MNEPRLPVARPLTDRQADILKLVAHGLSRREIAEVLGISPKTVDNLMSRAMDNLGAENRAQAVALAPAPKPEMRVCDRHRLCDCFLRERFGEEASP